jgi:hypothetical protein
MQLDEITDISQCSQLPVCVRCVHDDAIKEFLFYESLLETTKAVDVLEIVKRFLPNKTLTGKKRFILFAQTELLRYMVMHWCYQKEAPHVVTPCFLHKHALPTRTLLTTLKEVVSTVIKVINCIRRRSLNHIFKTFVRNGSKI